MTGLWGLGRWGGVVEGQDAQGGEVVGVGEEEVGFDAGGGSPGGVLVVMGEAGVGLGGGLGAGRGRRREGEGCLGAYRFVVVVPHLHFGIESGKLGACEMGKWMVCCLWKFVEEKSRDVERKVEP